MKESITISWRTFKFSRWLSSAPRLINVALHRRNIVEIISATVVALDNAVLQRSFKFSPPYVFRWCTHIFYVCENLFEKFQDEWREVWHIKADRGLEIRQSTILPIHFVKHRGTSGLLTHIHTHMYTSMCEDLIQASMCEKDRQSRSRR